MPEVMTRRRFVRTGALACAALAVGGTAGCEGAAAPEDEWPVSKMGAGKMRTLVVYGTKSGCTTGIAEAIGEALAAGGMSVDVVPAEKAGDPDGYDAVVVGSGVRAGSWHAAVREWVTANAATLKTRPVAFYTCCLTLAPEPEKVDEVRAYTDALIAESGVEPVDIGLFAGWNKPETFSLLERTILKLMKSPQGDFRDFEAVAAWTQAVAPRLRAS